MRAREYESTNSMRLQSAIPVLAGSVYDLRPWREALIAFPEARSKIVRDRGYESWEDYEKAMEKEDRIKQHCAAKMVQVIRSRLGQLCVARKYRPPLDENSAGFAGFDDDARERYNIYTPELQGIFSKFGLPTHERREFRKTSVAVRYENPDELIRFTEFDGNKVRIPGSVLRDIICITSITVFTSAPNTTFLMEVCFDGFPLVMQYVNTTVNGYFQTELFDGRCGLMGGPWIVDGAYTIDCGVPIESIIFTGWKSMSRGDEVESKAHTGNFTMFYHIPKIQCPRSLDPRANISHSHECGVCYGNIFVGTDIILRTTPS